MSWIITGSFAQPDEPEALAYIAAVEAADGQTLEDGVKFAYNSFIKGCKADGIWDAIKASCILAGARTLSGALVPLAGTAPTNFNFVDGDYNRETGLVGDGSTKYLDSNRNNNADPQNSNHCAVYCSVLQSTGSGQYPVIMGAGVNGTNGSNILGRFQNNGGLFHLNRSNSIGTTVSLAAGFIGTTRSRSSDYLVRASVSTTSHTAVSQTPLNGNVLVFATNNLGASGHTASRLAFYSIGESLNLAALDTRITTLMSDLAGAIP